MREDIKERIEMIKRGKVPEGYKKTKVGIVPEEWEAKKLYEMLEFQNGINAEKEKFGSGVKIASVMDILRDEPITYNNIKCEIDINDEILKRYSVTYGDVLFQRSSENIEDAGKSNIYLDNKMATFGGFVIRGKKRAEYNPMFLHEFMKLCGIRKQIMKMAAGVQHINIGQESLKEVEVVFPKLEIQDYIEQLILILDKKNEAQRLLIEEKQKQKKWLMQNLLTGKKTLKGFDGKLEKRKLSEILCEGSKERVSDTSKYKKITIKLNFGGLEFTDTKRVMADTRPFYVRKKDEIIIGKQNYFNGSIAMISEKYDGSICSNAIMSFKVREDFCNKDFLLYYLSQPDFIKRKSCMANGTGQKELSEKDFLKFVVKIPSIEEQNAIAKILSQADKEIEILQQQLEQTKLEKKAMMQLLLTGIVRVNKKGGE